MARTDKRSYKSTPKTRRGATTAFGSRTDVGSVRDHNEDSLLVMPPLFIVADGMGGHAAGEVASEIAVNVIANNAPEHPDSMQLGHAVEAANRAIISAALSGRGREGMGTTCTAAMLEGERLVIAQVGDSRAYLLHQGEMQQLTRDHSLMADMIEAGQITEEEARFHPNRSVITRALGSEPDTKPDLYEINVEAGDRLLLCSDGLSSMLRDSIIETILLREADPQRCASQLVNEAIAAGGHDNVTVIVVDVAGFRDQQQRRLARKTKVTVAFVLALVAAVIGLAVWGTNEYLHNSTYLGNDNGKVAIYKGIPDNFLGLTYSEWLETSDVNVSDLTPSVAGRIDEGMRVDSLDEAHKLIDGYRQDISDRQSRSGADTVDSTNSNEGNTSSSGNTDSSTSNSSSSNSSTSGSGSGAA
ncbi:MAG: Stp1/IreP family PP2C-type Ser/Thr phosphatase [Eggerthellaceae bacterium]|jgi:serine/threonine protein phosphatase PrpC